jgi:hypothetical protein
MRTQVVQESLIERSRLLMKDPVRLVDLRRLALFE